MNEAKPQILFSMNLSKKAEFVESLITDGWPLHKTTTRIDIPTPFAELGSDRRT
jgi:hypothetical protein